MRDEVSRPQVAARLSIEQRQYLLLGLLRWPAIFSQAKDQLLPEHFNQPDELPLRLLWETLLGVRVKMGDAFLFDDPMKIWQVLDAESKAALRQKPPEHLTAYWSYLFSDNPPGLLQQIYTADITRGSEEYARQLLLQFLHERIVSDAFLRLQVDIGDNVLTNFGRVTEVIRQKELAVSALGIDPVSSAAPEGWIPPAVFKKPTGILFLDKFLRGGHRAPETYAVLGVTGAGKTTLACQLCISCGALDRMWAADPSTHPGAEPDDQSTWGSLGWPYECGHTYLFHYEMSEADLRVKLWSSAAHIDLDRIAMMGHPSFTGLSASANLTPVERALYEQSLQGGSAGEVEVLAEQERLVRAQARLRVNVHQIDMTGDKHQGIGIGYVPEIASILERERQKGRRIACVCVDYADACIDRHTLDKDLKYAMLSQFGRRAEHEIGAAFQTPVWIFQQLSGESNSRTVATKQHHSNAAGCKSFANACWFAFNIGTEDPKTGCRYFTCSKARRSDLGQPPIIRIDGGFNQLIDMSGKYMCDSRGRMKPKAAEMPNVSNASGGSVFGNVAQPSS
jgi:hypothetical protein